MLKLTNHFKDRMEERKINMDDINHAIMLGIVEADEQGRKKVIYKGLVLVYKRESKKVKTMITCWAENYSFKKA